MWRNTSAGSLVVAAMLALAPAAAGAQREHPITETIRTPTGGLLVQPGAPFNVTLAVSIPHVGKVWHLYSITQAPGGPIRTRITVGPRDDFHLAGKITGTNPDVANDPNFGIMTETYSDSAIFSIPVASAPSASGTRRLNLAIYYQTCNDRYCLPPVEDTLGVDVSFVGAPVAAVASSIDTSSAVTPADTGTVQRIATITARLTRPGPATLDRNFGNPTLPGDGSLALFLWIAATMGALSLLTPCVFPMVPITVSYFSRDESRGRAQVFRDAGVYAGGIVVAFTALGLGLALVLGATGLNRFAANPWLNLAIAALFAGFALSLFGVINVMVPANLLTRADGLTRHSRFGRNGTTLLMGATFALTSFTCTAPFVGTLLVSATQGNWLWPALGLLVFSTVFALPFLVLALVPDALKSLPRSGEWMVTLKGVMGFLELAAAMKFLSNADLVEGWGVFTRNVVLAIWVVLGVCLVVYLLGVRIHRHSGRREGSASPPFGLTRLKPHMIAALITAAVVAWLASGLANRRLGELEAFLPPAGSNSAGVANSSELPWIVDDYDAALAKAKAEGKFVLIDFTGYTCTNCRWMEANMFPRADVRAELQQFVRVRLFTDGRDASNVRQQHLEETMYETVALPLYGVVGPDGKSRAHFLGMTRDAGEFVRFLSGARTQNP